MQIRQGMIALALFALACRTTMPPAQTSDLMGTAWRATTIADAGALADAAPTVAFESKRAHGSTGCNNYSAPVEILGSGLRFGRAATTRRICPGTVMEQEKRFLDVLENVRTYRLRGEFLELLDDSSLVLLRFGRNAGSAS